MTIPPRGSNEIQWAFDHASLEVRGVLRRLPSPDRPVGILGAVISEIHRRVTEDR